MYNFFHKMRRVGSHLRSCVRLAVSPLRWDFDYFQRDEEFGGAIRFIPALLATVFTVTFAAVAAAVAIVVIGVMGGAVALLQDAFNGIKSLCSSIGNFFSRKRRNPPPSGIHNDRSYGSSTSQMTKVVGNPGSPPKSVVSASSVEMTTNRSAEKKALPSETVDMVDTSATPYLRPSL